MRALTSNTLSDESDIRGESSVSAREAAWSQLHDATPQGSKVGPATSVERRDA
jgi:hypothetical protein